MVLEQFSYFANLNEYVRAGILFFGLLIILRIILYVSEFVLLKITSRTKTDLDDLLLKKSSAPLTYIAILLSLLFAIRELTLKASVELVILNIIYSLLAIVIGFFVFRVVDTSLIRVWKRFAEKTKSNIDDTIGNMVYEVLRVVLVIIIGIIILNIWGVNIGPLLAGLGIAGLAVALALQPILSNIFSGIAIISDGTLKTGDIVKLEGGELGEVYKIGLRTTRIKSFDNEMIIIPNSVIANSKLQNLLQPDPSIRINFDFGVEYGTDPEYVKKIVIEEIEKIEIRKKSEEIRVLFTEMGDNALIFKVMFWVDDIGKKWPAHQEAISRIYRRLYEEKIGIPFPQRTVWLREEGKAQSLNPSDKKFDKVKGKYFPAFGYEYKEKKYEEEKKESRKKGLFNRFRFRRADEE